MNWKVGDLVVERVVESERPVLAPSVLFPDATPAPIAAHRPWLEPHLLDPQSGLLILAFHSFVLRTPNHTILVDTCGGNHKPRPKRPRYHMQSWPYLENLAAAGLAPEAVDFVLCTHLHVDHVGWNTRLRDGRWVPTFPNARYLFGRVEWAHWEQQLKSPDYAEDPHLADSVIPIIEAGLAVFVESDHAIEDGVWLEPTPGHTPGHVAVHVASRGRRAVLPGDLMHHPLQCVEPDWSTYICTDPAQARATRRAFLDRHAESDTLIFPAHFPTPTAGRIVRAGATWGFAFHAGD